MITFTPDEWLIIVLVFVLGLLLGMAAMAGGKWKNRYREEVRRRQDLETDHKRVLAESRDIETARVARDRELETARLARERDDARRRTDPAPPV